MDETENSDLVCARCELIGWGAPPVTQFMKRWEDRWLCGPCWVAVLEGEAEAAVRTAELVEE